ncbi:ornithine cyclodeaminase family protein [Metaclostridioides mangenotii]|uniref:ornithine cyclodeaminase family protein n=1 Tax=Metaclostridioides mangenotii TaxID=1540 RepID=UPI0004821472|nr:ornithine cyclodeaminase family protein [Clostridioides mangenotii]
MLLLSKEDIKSVFTMKDAIVADKEAFRIFTEKKSVVPLRTNIPAPKHEGSLLFMPGYIEDIDCAGVKIVSVFPKNVEKGIPSTPATVLLLDGTTGEVCSILDGTYVTQIRTGAASGAAFDVLARKDAKIGALIGTGGQAESQLEAMLAARKLDEVRIFNRSLKKAQDFVNSMDKELASYDTKLVAVDNSDDAVDGADMIITVTTSNTPVFDGNKVKRGATISGVGSYQPNMQEIDPTTLTRASKIFFDSEEAVLAEAGDFIKPLEAGIISKGDFTGELGSVINGSLAGRENDDEIIVFKSVGISVQDVVTAKMIYDKALELGVGTKW